MPGPNMQNFPLQKCDVCILYIGSLRCTPESVLNVFTGSTAEGAVLYEGSMYCIPDICTVYPKPIGQVCVVPEVEPWCQYDSLCFTEPEIYVTPVLYYT